MEEQQSDESYASGQDSPNVAEGTANEHIENGVQKSIFYTEGSVELRDARMRIAKYSLPKAQLRIDAERLNA